MQYGAIAESPAAERKTYKSLYRYEKNRRDKLKRVALDHYRKAWCAEVLLTPEGLHSDTRCSDSDAFEDYLRIPEHTLLPERSRIAVAMFGHGIENDCFAVMGDLTKLCSGLLRYGGGTFALNKSPPTHNNLPPAHNSLPPAQNNLPPAHNNLPPAHHSRQGRTIFYPGEELREDGKCPFCGVLANELSVEKQVQHTHDCAVALMKTTLEAQYPKRFLDFQCFWGSCQKNFPTTESTTADVVQHLQSHIDGRSKSGSGSVCRWDTCTLNLPDKGLRAHLKLSHGVSVRETAFPGAYCELCLKWVECQYDWEDHCGEHIKTLNLKCVPTCALPGRCVFCLGDTTLPSSKRFKGFNKMVGLRQHLKRHIGGLQAMDQPIQCPHPLCLSGGAPDFTVEEFEDHLEKVHEVPKSSTKRKREGDENITSKRVQG